MTQRIDVIRDMLAEPIGSTTASNQAIGWRADCEYLLSRVDELLADLKECEPHLRSLASSCEACEGAGAIPEDESPCELCQPVRDLVKRINPPPPPPEPVYADDDDDIPF